MKDRFRILLSRLWNLAGGVSVRMKIFGIVLGSTLLLSLGFSSQVRTVLFNMLERETRGHGVSIARDVAARATDLLLINDLYSLHHLMAETQSNFDDVRYIFVLDGKGFVVAHTFGAGFPLGLIDVNTVAPEAYQNTSIIQTEEGLVWDVAVPIFDGEAGIARVGVSDKSMRQTLVILTSQLGLTILIVLAVSLLAATFLTWILTRPILSLVDATRLIAQGDFSPRVLRWANDEIGDLADAFNQMAFELERAEDLRKEREQLRSQLLEGVIIAQEDERRRIARELHDSTSQSLTSLKVGLRTIETCCDDPEVHARVSDLRGVISQTLDNVHNLAIQLRPAALDDLGLAAALERFVQEWQDRHKIEADLMVHIGEQRLPEVLETALYRIVQEALTNVARHACASSVSVLVERNQGDVVVVVEDDGKGFEVDKPYRDGHLGLLGIRERADLLSGQLTLESTPDAGTSVFVRIPLSEETRAEKGDSK